MLMMPEAMSRCRDSLEIACIDAGRSSTFSALSLLAVTDHLFQGIRAGLGRDGQTAQHDQRQETHRDDPRSERPLLFGTIETP